MKSSTNKLEIGPQDGPQRAFLETKAHIAIYGGAAGGGKSFALLLEPLRHFENAKFGAVIFRRSTTQIRNEGGLWDEAVLLYAPLGAEFRESFLEVEFPKGLRVKFAHLEYEKTVYDWHGSQIPLIGFDELTHFTEKQFFYMLSRNRSGSGVPGYIRATCNPDAESWIRRFIDWWIDKETGLAIKERSGVLRWFIRLNDDLVWGDSREELIEKHGEQQQPKSVTFIPSSIYDNKILMETDPSYLSNLMALPRVDRLRLLGANWNVKPTAGMFFQRGWFPIIDALPANVLRTVRAWDKAATKPSTANPDPDWTRGVKITKLTDGRFVVGHLASCRDTPLGVERLVKNTATQDGYKVSVSLAQDPGSAGVSDRDNFVRLLAGFVVAVNKPSSDKVVRAKPLSAQCEAGNVLVLRGDWNEDFFLELENFDGLGNSHDDIVDATADGFNELCGNTSLFDVL